MFPNKGCIFFVHNGTVSESTVSNPELSEFFTLTEFPLHYQCTSRRFSEPLSEVPLGGRFSSLRLSVLLPLIVRCPLSFLQSKNWATGRTRFRRALFQTPNSVGRNARAEPSSGNQRVFWPLNMGPSELHPWATHRAGESEPRPTSGTTSGPTSGPTSAPTKMAHESAHEG